MSCISPKQYMHIKSILKTEEPRCFDIGQNRMPDTRELDDLVYSCTWTVMYAGNLVGDSVCNRDGVMFCGKGTFHLEVKMNQR